MGTLSGGGKERVTIGRGCLLGAEPESAFPWVTTASSRLASTSLQAPK